MVLLVFDLTCIYLLEAKFIKSCVDDHGLRDGSTYHCVMVRPQQWHIVWYTERHVMRQPLRRRCSWDSEWVVASKPLVSLDYWRPYPENFVSAGTVVETCAPVVIISYALCWYVAQPSIEDVRVDITCIPIVRAVPG
jgi:hypothetical protein